MDRDAEMPAIVCQGRLQINVNIGRYLYMLISHTEWFAKRFFANMMQTFICGNKSVTTNFH
jgi:hypothetical protein